MKWIIYDVETDGLLDEVTRMHCFSYVTNENLTPRTVYTVEEIREIFENVDVAIGHNITRYDFPVLKKLFDFSPQVSVIDTLTLSWYLRNDRLGSHGLEAYGEEFKVPKPKIDDWENLSIEDYTHRCETDVLINLKLWQDQEKHINQIYGTDNVFHNVDLFKYLHFKTECLRDQEEQGIAFDMISCIASLAKAEAEYERRVEKLRTLMPAHLGRTIKQQPKKMYKQDGSISALGQRWFDALEEHNLPFNTTVIREAPDPGSIHQLKAWLFELNWKPETYKVSKNTGEKIPQVSLPFGGGICQSIKKLYPVFPDLEELDGMFMIKHRIGIFKSFLNNNKNGKLYATAHGFTNTMRLGHSKPIANLPGVAAPWGKEIRECLRAEPGHLFVGCDISGLESTTQQHFIHFFDPQYVEDMRTEGYDPHLEIAVLAGLLTKEDETFYKNYEEGQDKERYKKIKETRKTAKVANFAMTYGASAAKVAETAKITQAEAKILHATYHSRNWALKTICDQLQIKKVRSRMWQFNPVSKIWYFLKKKKDKFSTLNQGTGAYVFDMFLKHIKQNVEPLTHSLVSGQIHDEYFMQVPEHQKEQVKELVKQAMDATNQELGLNVTVEYDLQFGDNYADVH